MKPLECPYKSWVEAFERYPDIYKLRDFLFFHSPPASWQVYGLSIARGHVLMLTDGDLLTVVRGHWAVVDYLNEHPDVRAKYEPDQSGEIKYSDVLSLAEKEGYDIRYTLDDLIKKMIPIRQPSE